MFISFPILQSKSEDNDQELAQFNSTSHPPNQTGKKNTQINKHSRKARLVNRINSSFQTGSHLATLTESSSNIYFFTFFSF